MFILISPITLVEMLATILPDGVASIMPRLITAALRSDGASAFLFPLFGTEPPVDAPMNEEYCQYY